MKLTLTFFKGIQFSPALNNTQQPKITRQARRRENTIYSIPIEKSSREADHKVAEVTDVAVRMFKRL